jgi:3-oxoacyl-(acyl-carrier-protein) synthase
LAAIAHHSYFQFPEMKTYILSASAISPQPTFGGENIPDSMTVYAGNRMSCIEPDYKNRLDPKLVRRMSRILRMGAAAAMECMHQSGLAQPEAIVTGTALGCMEDTAVFLNKMVQHSEEALAPTAFIQSTHNTVGAQVALMLGCHAYNTTYVHRGHSFEMALTDALMLLQDKDAGTVLVGGIDEMTDVSHALLSRFGLFRQGETSNETLLSSAAHGTLGGEGAAFFLLGRRTGREQSRLPRWRADFHTAIRIR